MDTDPVELEEFMAARCDETATHWQKIWRAFQGDKRIDGGWDGWGELGRLVSACVDTTRGGREVAAMRKRLALFVEAKAKLYETAAHASTTSSVDCGEIAGRVMALRTVVKLDAMVFADHPDFQPKWRVDD